MKISISPFSMGAVKSCFPNGSEFTFWNPTFQSSKFVQIFKTLPIEFAKTCCTVQKSPVTNLVYPATFTVNVNIAFNLPSKALSIPSVHLDFILILPWF